MDPRFDTPDKDLHGAADLYVWRPYRATSGLRPVDARRTIRDCHRDKHYIG